MGQDAGVGHRDRRQNMADTSTPSERICGGRGGVVVFPPAISKAIRFPKPGSIARAPLVQLSGRGAPAGDRNGAEVVTA